MEGCLEGRRDNRVNPLLLWHTYPSRHGESVRGKSGKSHTLRTERTTESESHPDVSHTRHANGLLPTRARSECSLFVIYVNRLLSLGRRQKAVLLFVVRLFFFFSLPKCSLSDFRNPPSGMQDSRRVEWRLGSARHDSTHPETGQEQLFGQREMHRLGRQLGQGAHICHRGCVSCLLLQTMLETIMIQEASDLSSRTNPNGVRMLPKVSPAVQSLHLATLLLGSTVDVHLDDRRMTAQIYRCLYNF